MGSCRSLISVYAPGALPLDARASESPAFHPPRICPTWAAGSVPAEVFVWINAVGLGRFYQRVHNGAGLACRLGRHSGPIPWPCCRRSFFVFTRHLHPRPGLRPVHPQGTEGKNSPAGGPGGAGRISSEDQGKRRTESFVVSMARFARSSGVPEVSMASSM